MSELSEYSLSPPRGERIRARGERRQHKTSLARRFRHDSTSAENLFWHYLRARQLLGWKFLRQRPIGNYVVDFYCADAGLVVEVDCGQHLERTVTDQKRTALLESHGVKALRFWNDEVLKQTDAVLEQIAAALNSATPPQPSPQRGEEEKSC